MNVARFFDLILTVEGQIYEDLGQTFLNHHKSLKYKGKYFEDFLIRRSLPPLSPAQVN